MSCVNNFKYNYIDPITTVWNKLVKNGWYQMKFERLDNSLNIK